MLYLDEYPRTVSAGIRTIEVLYSSTRTVLLSISRIPTVFSGTSCLKQVSCFTSVFKVVPRRPWSSCAPSCDGSRDPSTAPYRYCWTFPEYCTSTAPVLYSYCTRIHPVNALALDILVNCDISPTKPTRVSS